MPLVNLAGLNAISTSEIVQDVMDAQDACLPSVDILRIRSGKPPSLYICNRCYRPGHHWKKDSPLIEDPAYEDCPTIGDPPYGRDADTGVPLKKDGTIDRRYAQDGRHMPTAAPHGRVLASRPGDQQCPDFRDQRPITTGGSFVKAPHLQGVCIDGRGHDFINTTARNQTSGRQANVMANVCGMGGGGIQGVATLDGGERVVIYCKRCGALQVDVPDSVGSGCGCLIM